MVLWSNLPFNGAGLPLEVQLKVQDVQEQVQSVEIEPLRAPPPHSALEEKVTRTIIVSSDYYCTQLMAL